MANFCLALKVAPSEYKKLTNREIEIFRAEHNRNVAKMKEARRR